LTQAKFAGVYIVPVVDVQVSGTYQSIPGVELAANQTITSSQTTLGRAFTGNANATINMLAPATQYGERLHQLDVRVGKLMKFGQTRTTVNVDLYNALNANTVLTEQSTFNSVVSAWRTPQSILTGSFAKFTVQFDF